VSSPLLALEKVEARLGGRPVLREVSFAIEPGEFTGLIGSNGAGKTTLLRVILGLHAPTSGSVLIDGRPRARRAMPGAVGYVPQKFLLDPDVPLRARDLVGLGLDGHRLGLPLPSRDRRERVEKALAAVGAESFADARVGELSGGEQQRVLIAHALIGRPRLLLLDEPLASLDLGSGREIVSLLHRLSRAHGIAVFISAHEINPLLGAMDRVVYIAAGRVASGSTGEVVRSEVLSRLYGQHVDVLNVHGRVIVVAGEGDPADPGADFKLTHADARTAS